jgi:hypothetical protein
VSSNVVNRPFGDALVFSVSSSCSFSGPSMPHNVDAGVDRTPPACVPLTDGAPWDSDFDRNRLLVTANGLIGYFAQFDPPGREFLFIVFLDEERANDGRS